MYSKESQKNKLKNHLYYLWSDYKWPLLAGLIVLLVAGYSLLAVICQKETVLYVTMIDCHTDTSPETMEKDFLKAAGYKTDEVHAEFLTNLMFENAGSGNYAITSLSRFLSDIGSNKLDICGMSYEDFLKYDQSGTWLDLREILDEKELFSLENALVVKNRRVIGIYADALSVLKEYGCYEGKSYRGVIGVLYNAPHKEIVGQYISFLADR